MTTTEAESDLLHAVAELSRLRLLDAVRVHGEAGPDGFVTGYRLRLGDGAGQEIERFVYVTTSPRGGEHPGVLRLHDESGDERAVWVYPNDPRLPALAHAVVPARASTLLAGFDPAWAEPGDRGSLELSIAAYRPGKRAVVRAALGSRRAYLKVVPPGGRARRIHDRHRAWRHAGIPVPRAFGFTDQGVVAIAEQPGLPATAALDRVDPVRLLDAVDELRRRIASTSSDVEARASLASRIDWYARRTRALAPELGERIRGIRRSVSATLEATVPERATIHGDLHLGQLFVDPVAPDHVVGLIDIDTAGVGDPADDEAALWAHLVATASHATATGDAIASARSGCLADSARARWGGEHDDAGRARRVGAIAATHLLGHALTGSVAPLDAIETAERLLVP